MDKEKHLELIENIISRMANCSFLIKGWTLTIVAAVFGLAAKDSNIKFIIIAYIIIPCFWILDAFYLSKERQYRSLYDKVRKSSDSDFSMNTSEFNNGKNTWINTIYSKTLNLFYIPLIVIILIIMFVFKNI
ncbi:MULTISPECIES: hypothetical protein [Treponema]|jgi:hypothetical protein|uniref:hypothetical protein n=1 Tax=Treponema TaxID=157 RepID=UPI0020A264D9|nr:MULTISPECIES: hypothetical protein [Treponema]UTC56083.1 hypothetical protein E4N69_03050 [Treponema sp. OMZ 906]UTY26161.1 hypothetical protein E4N77_05350 [Treponema denticola]